MASQSFPSVQNNIAVQSSDDADMLTQLIEDHLKLLSEKIALSASPQELQDEINTLNDILSSFKYRAELIAKLLDGATSKQQRDDIMAILTAQRVQVQQNGDRLSDLLSKSNELIKLSSSLIARAQEQVDRRAYKFIGYTLKPCGMCKGIADAIKPCTACKNKGRVLVREPAMRCPNCEGSGKRKSSMSFAKLCIDCKGTGWLSMRLS